MPPFSKTNPVRFESTGPELNKRGEVQDRFQTTEIRQLLGDQVKVEFSTIGRNALALAQSLYAQDMQAAKTIFPESRPADWRGTKESPGDAGWGIAEKAGASVRHRANQHGFVIVSEGKWARLIEAGTTPSDPYGFVAGAQKRRTTKTSLVKSKSGKLYYSDAPNPAGLVRGPGASYLIVGNQMNPGSRGVGGDAAYQALPAAAQNEIGNLPAHTSEAKLETAEKGGYRAEFDATSPLFGYADGINDPLERYAESSFGTTDRDIIRLKDRIEALGRKSENAKRQATRDKAKAALEAELAIAQGFTRYDTRLNVSDEVRNAFREYRNFGETLGGYTSRLRELEAKIASLTTPAYNGMYAPGQLGIDTNKYNVKESLESLEFNSELTLNAIGEFGDSGVGQAVPISDDPETARAFIQLGKLLEQQKKLSGRDADGTPIPRGGNREFKKLPGQMQELSRTYPALYAELVVNGITDPLTGQKSPSNATPTLKRYTKPGGGNAYFRFATLSPGYPESTVRMPKAVTSYNVMGQVQKFVDGRVNGLILKIQKARTKAVQAQKRKSK